MLHYGMGLIVYTVLFVAAAAVHSGLSGGMTVDSTKSAVPEFSDEERGRIFDGVMRISDAPVIEMAAPEVAHRFFHASLLSESCRHRISFALVFALFPF
jgi:hypothetical protein